MTLVSPRPGSDVWESKLVLLTTAIVLAEDSGEWDEETQLEAVDDADEDAWFDASTAAS